MTTKNYHFDSKKLEINQEGRGIEIHPLVGLLISPIIGLMFLMFLPFIGFYLVAQALVQKAHNVFVRPVLHNAMVPVPVPGKSNLTGSEQEEGKSETAEDPKLEELAKEVQARRDA